jgi:hypothetical protein
MQPLRLNLHVQRNMAVLRRRRAEVRGDLDGAERPQVEHRLLRRRDERRGVGLSRLDVDRDAHRRLGQLAESLDVHLAEATPRAGLHPKGERPRVAREVDVGDARHLHVGVTPVTEGALHGLLRLLELFFVERLAVGDVPLHGAVDGRGRLGVDALQAEDVHAAGGDDATLLDLDRDVDVLVARVDDAAGARVRLVIAARAIGALDALQIALEDVGVEELIVVDDPAEEPEELRAGRRRQLVRDVVLVERVVPFDRHRVDRGGALRDRCAPEGRRREEACHDRPRYAKLGHPDLACAGLARVEHASRCARRAPPPSITDERYAACERSARARVHLEPRDMRPRLVRPHVRRCVWRGLSSSADGSAARERL